MDELKPPPMSDADREAVLRSLPDMLDGFLKTWGWLHFAKGIEAARDAQWLSIVGGLQRDAAAREREACAKVCDEQHDRARTSTGAARADACAAAIRARGEKGGV